MNSQTVLKAEPAADPAQSQGYDEALWSRFSSWKRRSGNSVNDIARKISRSGAAVSQYLNFKYEGNIPAFEKDIRDLLRREETAEYTVKPDIFCDISPSRLIWGVLDFCYQERKMGAILANSGLSKTRTAEAYQKKNYHATLVTADITRKSLNAILEMIAFKLNCTQWPATNRNLLDGIIRKLNWSKNLLIIDESHLLCWEAFEAVRTIYDRCETGVVYVGQPRLYSQMRGNRAYLWDHILSRITVQRSITGIEKADVKLIADSVYPGLPKNCLTFLYEKALGPGKLRVMTELLTRAVHVSKTEQVPLNLNLLKEINTSFFLQEVF